MAGPGGSYRYFDDEDEWETADDDSEEEETDETDEPSEEYEEEEEEEETEEEEVNPKKSKYNIILHIGKKSSDYEEDELEISGNTIVETVTLLAKSKVKDYKSLTNKAVFKY